MYKIDIDFRYNLISIKMTGFWALDNVAAFKRDERAAVASLDCVPGEHIVLVDLSDFKIQSQEVIAALRVFIQTAVPKASHIGFVRGEGLAHIQSRHVMVRDNMATFGKRIDALDWLLSQRSHQGAQIKMSDVGMSVQPRPAYAGRGMPSRGTHHALPGTKASATPFMQ